MVDLSPQMENALKKHYDVSSNIAERQTVGKRLYIAAWIVEIIAVLTGFAIATSTPWVTYAEMESPTLRDGLMLFQGALPLFAIAVVEATKIPLAQGFYMSKILKWKVMFLFSLVLLILVTFETMFNGLETYFTFTTNRIVDEETTISEKKAIIQDLSKDIKDKENTISKLESLSEVTISQDFQENIDNINSSKEQELNPLYLERDAINTEFEQKFDLLEGDDQKLNTKSIQEDARVTSLNNLEQNLRKEKKEVAEKIQKKYQITIDNLKKDNTNKNELIKVEKEAFGIEDGAQIAKWQKNIDDNISELKQIDKKIKKEINEEEQRLQTEINETQKKITEINSSNIKSSDSKEKRISAKRERLEKEKDDRIKRIQIKIDGIERKFKLTTDDSNAYRSERLASINEEKKQIPILNEEIDELKKNNHYQ